MRNAKKIASHCMPQSKDTIPDNQFYDPKQFIKNYKDVKNNMGNLNNPYMNVLRGKGNTDNEEEFS